MRLLKLLAFFMHRIIWDLFLIKKEGWVQDCWGVQERVSLSQWVFLDKLTLLNPPEKSCTHQ